MNNNNFNIGCKLFNFVNVCTIYICTIICFAIINLISLGLNNNTKIMFNIYLIVFIQILIFVLFKSDIISILTFLTTITLIPSLLVFYNKTVQNLGDLTIGVVPIYMYEDTFYVFIFITSLSFAAYILKLNIFRHEIFSTPLISLSNLSIIVNNIIAMMSSIIAFPDAPRFGSSIGENGFNGLLPGHSWNQVAIVALLFNLKYLFKKKSVTCVYLFVIFWFIFHGERVDIVGLLLLLVMLVCSSKEIVTKVKIFAVFLSICIIILFISIKSGLSISNSFRHIFTFTTISDTSYELNDGINYFHVMGRTHGKILLNILGSIIPLILIVKNHSLGSFLLSMNIYYPGGASMIDAPLMDWGSMGVMLVPIVYSFLIKLITKMKFIFAKYEIFVLICLSPRIAWYGIGYTFTSVIFIMPIIYFLDSIINKYVKYNDVNKFY